ncbi:MAG: YggT family protein [Anaerolineae bacterium]|nr:YggT family protein [Anaerolineae bacterium]MCO5186937.1 YggT family protein [Anaerolineae bacterium]
MIATIINTLFTFLTILVFARVIVSWVRISPSSSFFPVVRFIHDATEPFLAPIRRVLPPSSGLDFSPIILLFILYFAQTIIGSLLR